MKQFDFHLTSEQRIEKKKALDSLFSIFGIQINDLSTEGTPDENRQDFEDLISALIHAGYFEPSDLERIDFYDFYMYFESRKEGSLPSGYYYVVYDSAVDSVRLYGPEDPEVILGEVGVEKAIDSKEQLLGGKADYLTVQDLAVRHNVSTDQIQQQLDKGIQIELEHTTEKEKAKEIAMDHLFEFPDYYDRLAKMENR